MTRNLMLVVPATMALLTAGCTPSGPTNAISPVPNVGAGVGNAPGNPVSPNSPPAVTGSLTNTDVQSPAPGATRSRSGTSNATGFGGTRRAPGTPQQEGNGGS